MTHCRIWSNSASHPHVHLGSAGNLETQVPENIGSGGVVVEQDQQAAVVKVVAGSSLQLSATASHPDEGCEGYQHPVWDSDPLNRLNCILIHTTNVTLIHTENPNQIFKKDCVCLLTKICLTSHISHQ